MKIQILALLLSVAALSCAEKTPTVKQVKKMTPEKELKNVVVFNSEDPICQMKTAEFLKDTAVFKDKIYGFCSDHCKSEFLKKPEAYAQEH